MSAVRKQKIRLREVNRHLVCRLCRGYYVDATTIAECLHSFCRSCIIKYLEKNSFCPVCEVQIHKTKPYLNLRLDKALQDVVYKLVPGLYHSEMARRRTFYADKPHLLAVTTPEQRGVEERLIFSPEDSVSLSLEFIDRPETDHLAEVESTSSSEEDFPLQLGLMKVRRDATAARKESTDSNEPNIYPKRFLQCPALVTIKVLKKFLVQKFEVPNFMEVEILHKRVPLADHYMLMDVAYIFTWKRMSPMRLFYQINRIERPSTLIAMPASNLEPAEVLAEPEPAAPLGKVVRKSEVDEAKPSEPEAKENIACSKVPTVKSEEPLKVLGEKNSGSEVPQIKTETLKRAKEMDVTTLPKKPKLDAASPKSVQSVPQNAVKCETSVQEGPTMEPSKTPSKAPVSSQKVQNGLRNESGGIETQKADTQKPSPSADAKNNGESNLPCISKIDPNFNKYTNVSNSYMASIPNGQTAPQISHAQGKPPQMSNGQSAPQMSYVKNGPQMSNSQNGPLKSPLSSSVPNGPHKNKSEPRLTVKDLTSKSTHSNPDPSKPAAKPANTSKQSQLNSQKLGGRPQNDKNVPKMPGKMPEPPEKKTKTDHPKMPQLEPNRLYTRPMVPPPIPRILPEVLTPVTKIQPKPATAARGGQSSLKTDKPASSNYRSLLKSPPKVPVPVPVSRPQTLQVPEPLVGRHQLPVSQVKKPETKLVKLNNDQYLLDPSSGRLEPVKNSPELKPSPAKPTKSSVQQLKTFRKEKTKNNTMAPSQKERVSPKASVSIEIKSDGKGSEYDFESTSPPKRIMSLQEYTQSEMYNKYNSKTNGSQEPRKEVHEETKKEKKCMPPLHRISENNSSRLIMIQTPGPKESPPKPVKPEGGKTQNEDDAEILRQLLKRRDAVKATAENNHPNGKRQQTAAAAPKQTIPPPTPIDLAKLGQQSPAKKPLESLMECAKKPVDPNKDQNVLEMLIAIAQKQSIEPLLKVPQFPQNPTVPSQVSQKNINQALQFFQQMSSDMKMLAEQTVPSNPQNIMAYQQLYLKHMELMRANTLKMQQVTEGKAPKSSPKTGQEQATKKTVESTLSQIQEQVEIQRKLIAAQNAKNLPALFQYYNHSPLRTNTPAASRGGQSSPNGSKPDEQHQMLASQFTGLSSDMSFHQMFQQYLSQQLKMNQRNPAGTKRSMSPHSLSPPEKRSPTEPSQPLRVAVPSASSQVSPPVPPAPSSASGKGVSGSAPSPTSTSSKPSPPVSSTT